MDAKITGVKSCWETRYSHSLQISPHRLLINYKRKMCLYNGDLVVTTSTKWSILTLAVVRQTGIMCLLMWYNTKYIYVLFLNKTTWLWNPNNQAMNQKEPRNREPVVKRHICVLFSWWKLIQLHSYICTCILYFKNPIPWDCLTFLFSPLLYSILVFFKLSSTTLLKWENKAILCDIIFYILTKML